MSKNDNNSLCVGCPQFEQHEDSRGRNEHNCVKWLCNCGACSHDAELAAANPPASSMLQGLGTNQAAS